MPELPEVETVRRGLERAVVGARITGVLVANPQVLHGQPPDELRERAAGRIIDSVKRRGKYLLLPLLPFLAPDTPLSICIHLKMRGHLAVEPADSEPGKYLCVTLNLAKPDGTGAVLRFYDMWRWGELRVLTGAEVAERVPALAAMGPEPLDEGWGSAQLSAALAGRRMAVKPVLLDQSVVAGVGNIYADEALFRAGIHPTRIAATLGEDERERLAEAIRSILGAAVEGGGTTSESFGDVDGAAGRFTPRVYDRGGAPCFACGTTLTRIRLAGRSSVFCGVCQNAP